MKKKKTGPHKHDDEAIDDPDSPELTPEMIRRMRPMREVYPEFVKEIKLTRSRGRPKLEHPKVQVTLRLDADVVGAFKEDGPGWQGRINEELKKTVKRQRRRT
jgi:uncharacterized protein (DUF4415 family)